MNFLLLVRLGWIEWCVRSLGIAHYAASLGELRVVIRTIPVAAPLPDVAGHVVKAVTIRWKFRDRCDAGVAIFARVFHREFSLPGIGHPFPAGAKFVAPCIRFAGQSPARGKFKLGFGRTT